MAESNEQRQVVRADDSDGFVPYDTYGTAIEGMAWRNISRDAETGLGSFLLRMAPGARSRPHEHVAIEEFYVIEGELVDFDGSVFRAGDFVSFRAGSVHCSWSPRGCVLVVFLRAINRPLGPDEPLEP
jgi:anti-sigma factor ChrR (cupin superfamily)